MSSESFGCRSPPSCAATQRCTDSLIIARLWSKRKLDPFSTLATSQGEKWLSLDRNGAIVTWTREDGNGGRMEISASGRLRSEASEEEMDLAAEAWARELMR